MMNFPMQLPMYKILFFVLLFSCKPNKTVTTENTSVIESTNVTLPEDFIDFYKKFHEDSAFQMSRIHFPLEGLPDNADPEFIGNEQYFWAKDQWVINRSKFDNPKLYKVEYNVVANILVEETITILEYDLKIIRRFVKNSDGWNLIYYAGVNKYSQLK